MKKIMISQPMAGFTDDQILETKSRFLKFAEQNNYEDVNTFFQGQFNNSEDLEKEGVLQIPVKFLAKAIDKMSLCNAVYFAKGWENARGCKIEHEIAIAYGLEVIYED